MFKLAAIASLALALPAQVLSVGLEHKWAPRADPDCTQLPTSNGGRKIAIVVDSSGSNADTDPSNLRIVAAKNLNNLLISKGQASSGKQSDLVTVVDFDYSATVIYPLGDPAGATNDIFDSIDASGGTDIASGVEAAIDELTKNQGDVTAGRSGIVVLTDGEDSYLDPLLEQLARAKKLGIRVAFGFLSPQPPSDASDLLSAILDTGGIYSTITSDQAQEAFVNLVVSHGLTGVDNASGSAGGPTVLYAGLAIAGNVSSKSSPKVFTYSAQGGGEKLNFTVDALSGQTLDVKLRDKKSAKDIDTTTTDQSGHAELLYTASQAQELSLEISTTNATSGLFTVGFNSSLGRVNRANPCKPTNTTNNKYVFTFLSAAAELPLSSASASCC
ncbi:MAG: hypothetical protein Q9167_006094 [Letrouitia subvulpina]